MAYPELPMPRTAEPAAARAPSSKDAAPAEPPAREFARALRQALVESPHRISPKFFYDAAGSALFDRICELPEYYPTRTELALLDRHAEEMAALIGPEADLIEFGAGSATKVRLLLAAMQRPRRFVPIDISAEHLQGAAAALRRDHPGLDVQPLAADFTKPIQLPPMADGSRPQRVGFFPGSSIGNFAPDEAVTFLRQAAELLRGGGLLIGTDLVKDPALLHAAYNDAAGVTTAFNLNLLERANRELGTDFDTGQFAHYAFYEPRLQRIEMHLVSRRTQAVSLNGESFQVMEGQTLHTENSHKFTVEGFRRLARQAGFTPGTVWTDPKQHFAVHWLAAPL